MEEFYDDWIKRKKYWFSQNDENDKYLCEKYGYLIDEKIEDNNLISPIIKILIYDQLTRHYYRKENNKHILNYFNNKALRIVEKYKNSEYINSLDINDWIFYMLVYRHSNNRENILYVMDECWKREPIPKNFIKATYMRANFEEKLERYYNDEIEYDKSILDNNSSLEISKEILYKIGYFNKIEEKKIIISLSGGVDSVVCLYNICRLYKDRDIKALHINYNNREEVDEEVKFLRTLCKKLNVELYVRRIDEIKRKKCMINDLRDIYEIYTKKIRFNSYRVFGENPIVILGHNKDDCLENILTNIAYNNKYENLKGIEYECDIENIKFIRPLIDISKDEIYKFGNNHNLPYLKNSTPDWCQRGKIRNEIKPVLYKWDKRLIDGLFNLSEIMTNYNEILKHTIERFKIREIGKLEELNISKIYWKYGIYKVYRKYISNKSLKSMIERLELWKIKYDKIDINKQIKIIINKNIELIIIKRIENNYEYILNKKMI